MLIPINLSTNSKESKEEMKSKAEARGSSLSWILRQVMSQLPDKPTEPIEVITLDFTPDEE